MMLQGAAAWKFLLRGTAHVYVSSPLHQKHEYLPPCATNHNMNVSAIVSQLKAERDRLDKAIAALNGIGGTRQTAIRGRRRMSAEARRRISAAAKKRWAAWKAEGKKH